jgi:hypothetical protein
MTNKSLDVLNEYAEKRRAWLAQPAPASPRPRLFLYIAYTVPHAGGWLGVLESGAPVPSDGMWVHVLWRGFCACGGRECVVANA